MSRKNGPGPLAEGDTGPTKSAATTKSPLAPAVQSTGPDDDPALFEFAVVVGAQLRRRRQSSLRCEPMPDGRRDTLGSRRRRKRDPGKHLLAEVGKRTVWLRDGDRGDRVFAMLDAVGIERRQWDSGRRCWMVSVSRADDVLAFAEYSERWTVSAQVVDR